jgi:hypothetical protein
MSNSNNESLKDEFTEKNHYAKFLFALFSGPKLKKNDPTWNLWYKQNQIYFIYNNKGHKISACS